MPIYEYYCPDCHTIFSFLSKTIANKKLPACPKCKRPGLDRQISMFAMTGKARGDEAGGGDELAGIDESKMEQAVNALASEAGGIDENDPRQAAQLMRKFSKMTGIEFGSSMSDALSRLEAGEDPDKIEAELGDVMENEEPFLLPGQKGKGRAGSSAPLRDQTLYEL